jgi:hypothetical protein
MQLEPLRRLVRPLRHWWEAFVALAVALCLMAAGTAQGAGPDGHKSVTPGKVKSEV